MHKCKKTAYFIFSGTVFYILYSFIVYIFGLHFNNLFLLYCLILGLSFYILILVITEFYAMNVQEWFNNNVPVRTIGVYFIIIASMFYLVWLMDIIPAIISNTVPKAVSKFEILVNPVHVLDIAFALPGLIIAGVLLMRKKTLGFIFSPILIYIILLPIALIAMVIISQINGVGKTLLVEGICVVFALVSIIILISFLKAIKK